MNGARKTDGNALAAGLRQPANDNGAVNMPPVDPASSASHLEPSQLYVSKHGERAGANQNEQGYRQRGRRFNNNSVYRILRETAYIGTAYFNKRDSRTNTDKPEAEWIPMPCPSIIDKDTFAAVQRQLTERHPKRRRNARKPCAFIRKPIAARPRPRPC